MKNQESLKQGIFNYLDMPNTGALMVTGSWGCGKSYYFENVLFEELRKKGHKPVRVSLFGMTSLEELSKNIVCEFLQYLTDKKWIKSVVKVGANLFNGIKDVPAVGDYIDLKGILSTGKTLYKLIPNHSVICLDDLERAVEKFDINDLLGAINDLVENQHQKVIVIANKEYIDGKQPVANDNKVGKHEIFYEKVIEKTLHFVPCIEDVFATLVDCKNDKFQTFMSQKAVRDSVNPFCSKSKAVRKQKENIRTLKFAVSHFKYLFDCYVQHGEDVGEEYINRQLINQWLFIYAISLESKRNTLSLDNYMGIDTYIPTATFDNIDLGDDKESLDLFDESEKASEVKDINISQTFVRNYYGDKSVEYVFYPQIYRFVLGGIDFDFEELRNYTQTAFERFDYKSNPGQEELGKWMGGYWTMTDAEAKDSLERLQTFVKEGQLTNLMSYYNASVFLFKCRELIGMKEEDLLALFENGLRTFVNKTPHDTRILSLMKVIPVENEEICGKVHNMILTLIKEKQQEQMQHDVEKMKQLFSCDIQKFIRLFIPHEQTTPKYLNTPMLHLLSEEEINNVVDKASPNDIMNLYTLVVFRYNSSLLPNLMKENTFIMRLKKSVQAKQDAPLLSSMIMRDQLLPELDKVEERMSQF